MSPGEEGIQALSLRTGKPRAWWLHAALMAALVSLLHVKVVLLGHTWILRDWLTLVLPSRQVLRDALVAGRLPEWNDLIGFGLPFAANPLHQVFYPPAWLVAFVPPPLGADLIALAHLWWLGFGMCLLAGRLGVSFTGAVIAGGVATASGYVGSMVVSGRSPVRDGLDALGGLAGSGYHSRQRFIADESRPLDVCSAGVAAPCR